MSVSKLLNLVFLVLFLGFSSAGGVLAQDVEDPAEEETLCGQITNRSCEVIAGSVFVFSNGQPDLTVTIIPGNNPPTNGSCYCDGPTCKEKSGCSANVYVTVKLDSVTSPYSLRYAGQCGGGGTNISIGNVTFSDSCGGGKHGQFVELWKGGCGDPDATLDGVVWVYLRCADCYGDCP